MDFDRVIEKLIRKAQEEGKFDNLRGKGQPLRLDENAFEDPASALVNHMLKDQGFRPEWLEEDLSLRQELDDARRALVRTRHWRAQQLAALGARQDARAIEQRVLVAHEWDQAQDRFRRKVAELNQTIFVLNLKVPNTHFQRVKLNVEEELQRLVAGGSADPDTQ
jgi:DnaJ family protein C protein 28